MPKNFIDAILKEYYPDEWETISDAPVIDYLKRKTKSVNKESKARGSFANLYAIYVLVEDYINQGYHTSEKSYSDYVGADYTPLLNRQRELRFGSKLQNHALNSRLNEEFYKFHEIHPIRRDVNKGKYWINEEILIVEGINIAPVILKIIDQYIALKSENFTSFFAECLHFSDNVSQNPEEAKNFVLDQLAPDVDARIFEIVSFCILKYSYLNENFSFLDEQQNLIHQSKVLYKTGRTNANDGGIDFILIPQGRVYQVTETLDFKKYFLDIDKLNKFPITFVVKSNETSQQIFEEISEASRVNMPNEEIRSKYLDCFEEIISIPLLEGHLQNVIVNGKFPDMIQELVVQCKVEFNIEE